MNRNRTIAILICALLSIGVAWAVPIEDLEPEPHPTRPFEKGPEPVAPGTTQPVNHGLTGGGGWQPPACPAGPVTTSRPGPIALANSLVTIIADFIPGATSLQTRGSQDAIVDLCPD